MSESVTSTFEAFYAGTSSRLLRYAFGLTGDMAEAQDLTQEAYARAWPRWKRLQRYEHPESWLRERELSGIDWRTGGPVWTIESAPDTTYTGPQQNRFAELEPSGVLRMRDVRTGKVLSTRSGVPATDPGAARLLDDWLYLPGKDKLQRIRVTGSEPASELTASGDLYPMPCGKHVCVAGGGVMTVFDRQTGKQPSLPT